MSDSKRMDVNVRSTEDSADDGHKLYRINDHDWVAASSLQQALEWCQREYELSAEEIVDERRPPGEVSPEEMQTLVYVQADGARVTFAEQWANRFSLYSYRSNEAFLFASTDW